MRSMLLISCCVIFVALQSFAPAAAGDMRKYQLYANHAQDAQSINDMAMMKSEEPDVVLKTDPEKIKVGTPETITISIRDAWGKPVQELAMTHERIMHVVIASRDFTVFSHIHPEDFGPITTRMKKTAQYSVHYTFPKSGRYIIGIDFGIKDRPYSKHFVIDVAGGAAMGAPVNDFTRQKKFGNYDVTLTTAPETIAAGKETTLIYRFNRDGAPVNDLEPYIAAVMHVAVISADLKQFIHEHGLLPGMAPMGMHELRMMHEMSLPRAFGPEIKVPVTFPAAGIYEIFGEVKHKGKVIVTHFMVEVD
jgi:hypothetical protein